MVDLSPPPHTRDVMCAPSRAPERASAGASGNAPDTPAVSIVLPVHNGERFLEAAIESILSQTHSDFELIAVDDCSGDATPQILAAHAARDPRMRIVTLVQNAKLPGALNAGFALSRADWLTWTSDDNILHPDMLARLLAQRDAHPHADILYAGYRVIDDTGQPVGQVAAAPVEQILERNVVGCCFLYRRAVSEALSGYDETLFGVEDYDFWLRAARAGFTLQPVDAELYDYRRHERSLTDRRWHEIRQKVARVLEREIALSPQRNLRAAAWLSLLTGNPYEPAPRFLINAIREHPPTVIARLGDLLAWARYAIAWRLK